MQIPGIVYIIIGTIITVFSLYITSISEKLPIQKFYLFIAAGIIFMIIGIFKMIKSAFLKPKLAKENFSHNNPSHPNKMNKPSLHSPKSQQQSQNTMIKFCSKCGAAARNFDHFCYKCGSRLFHSR